MRLLVCVKRVPAPGARINLTADERAIDPTHLAFTTSPHEECALEAAVQLVEHHGGEVTVLTVGPDEAAEQLRYAVSVGAHAAVLMPTDGEDPDPQRTAAVIVAAVRRLEEGGGPFDLLLFGNESADAGGFQVGIRVAVALDRPIVNGAKELAVSDGVAHVEREADAGRETYALALQAVVGVREGINLPRYPTMKGRLASKKVAVERFELDAPAGGQRMIRLRRPPERVSQTVVLGRGPDAAPAVVDLLTQLGVLT